MSKLQFTPGSKRHGPLPPSTFVYHIYSFRVSCCAVHKSLQRQAVTPGFGLRINKYGWECLWFCESFFDVTVAGEKSLGTKRLTPHSHRKYNSPFKQKTWNNHHLFSLYMSICLLSGVKSLWDCCAATHPAHLLWGSTAWLLRNPNSANSWVRAAVTVNGGYLLLTRRDSTGCDVTLVSWRDSG